MDVDVIGDVGATLIARRPVHVHGNSTVILVDLWSTSLTSSMVGITIRVAFSFRRTATTTIRVAIPFASTITLTEWHWR